MTISLAASFRPSEQKGGRQRPDETLGVFSDGTAWKVYSQFDPAAAYPSRQEALVAAEARAFAAARAGREVELFVQKEDGSLEKAALDLH